MPKWLRLLPTLYSFKNKKLDGNPVFSMPVSEVRLIEYWNGKKDYLEGSYANYSDSDTATEITGVEALDSKVYVAGIAFHIERLFTEYHLIMDYTKHPDSNFKASKGKIEFEFERPKINFFVKYFPTGEKTVFSKFHFDETGENKKYAKLANEPLTTLVIYYDDSVSTILLEPRESERLNEMFSGKDIRYKP